MTDISQVARHYEARGLKDRLAAALEAGGFAGRPVSIAALAPLDQFHTRGLAATVELASAARLSAMDLVLDVGAGLGGPSRYLAATYGCKVEGIDLSPAFVEAATYLAERAGLADKVNYSQGDALALPFAAQSFDVAWTQHVAMNIHDRDRLYGEIHRVLRARGRLAIYDVVVGSGEPLHFPVPWSRGPETSFLLAPDAMRRLLERQGFTITDWVDRTADSLAWFAQNAHAPTTAPSAPPAFGLHLAMGPEFGRMAANLARNFKDGRVRVIETVAIKNDCG